MDGTGMTFDIRIRMRKDGALLFGSGISELLLRTGEAGSLRQAASSMGMSYRKALSIVRRAEENFGTALLETAIGGQGGGGSALTPFAKTLAARFSALEQAARAAVEAEVSALFPGASLSTTLEESADPGRKDSET